ncbi:MAG: 1-acyl-sn-glycerol-3-phosphate acyltransferase [Candidatus Cloacimonetes bacterium]|nr:1-acyl-sn-glycerol-3-phosphate acyltransferase [Candidatus Cloacimonadota bacterium]
MSAPRQARIVPWIHGPSMALLRALARGWFRTRVDGQQKLPSGPFVGVMNHSSQMDIPAMALAVPIPVYYFGKRELFAGPLGFWFHAMGGVPVARGQRDTHAFDEALRLLRSGQPFFLAPEGTRHHDGRGSGKVHTGFVRLALLAGCPVLPVAVAGARECLPPGKAFPRRGRLRVRVGDPLHLDPVPVDPEHHEELARQAARVMRIIYDMKQELDLGLSGEGETDASAGVSQ